MRNKILFEDFEKWISTLDFADETKRKHIRNISVYLIEYLDKFDLDIEDSVSKIDEFFDSEYVNSESKARSFISSIKKFYTFLRENDELTEITYLEFKMKLDADKNMWKSSQEG